MSSSTRPTGPARTPFLAGAILIVLALAALVWVHHVNTLRLLETTQRVERAWETTVELGEALSVLKDAETGQRGYLLTGEPGYLEPYTAAVNRVPGHLNRLRTLTADSPSQQKRVAALGGLVDVQLGELAKTIRLFSAGDSQAARREVESGEDKKVMDQIRQIVDAAGTEENTLLAQRARLARDTANRLTTVSILGTAGFLVLLAVFLAVVRRDLIGRTKAEAEVREREEQLRITLWSIGDGVLVTDPTGKVTFLNPVAERLTGWPSSDAVGRPVEEVFRIVNEESRVAVDSPIRRILREGVVVGLANHTVLISRGGSETPIADSGAPVRDQHGRITGVVLVFRDIAEQRRAEHAVQRLAAIAASTEYAIIGETVDNVITDWNSGAQVLFGYTQAEMIGRRMLELGSPEDANTSAELTRRIVAGGRAGEFDVRRRTKDGRWLDVAVNLYPIHAVDGTVIGISRLMRDVTEKRRQEAELQAARERAVEANAAKDRFLATLSHELRTPLTPVMASVHRLERRTDLGEGVAASLAMIRRNVELEARLIDDLLDLTRIARGKITLDRAPLDLHEVLSNVVQNSRSEFFAKDVALELHLDAAHHACLGDSARLQQIFWNLLRNSVKFTPPGGRVTLTSQNPSAGVVRVVVADNGQGIGRELLARLFMPFEQGETTQVRRGGGLGLGLAIARNLAQLHQGTITATSEGGGRGAAFAVDLPTTEDTPAPAASSSQVDDHVAGIRGHTAVLLVEDDVDSGQALHDLLQDAGFDIRIADRVDAAVSLFEERPADILVTDIGLPDGSGLSLLATLKAKNPLLRAIVLSGHGMESDTLRSRSLGFSEHFVKPLNLNRLIATLDRLSEPA